MRIHGLPEGRRLDHPAIRYDAGWSSGCSCPVY
jgi:hypothetical protein